MNDLHFPINLDLNGRVYKNGEVLEAEYLNSLQQELNELFTYTETAINFLHERSDSELSNLIGYKGIINIKTLTTLAESLNGDIYILKDDTEVIQNFNNLNETSFSNEDFLICTESFSIGKAPTVPLNRLWINKKKLLEAASELNSGIVTTAMQYFAGIKAFLDGIILRGSLFEADVSKITLIENGIEKELPDKGTIQHLEDDIISLKEGLTIEAIPDSDINALFSLQ